MKAMLGGDVSSLPPEVTGSTQAISARIKLRDETYSMLRQLVSTPSSRVEVAGPSEALRLPLSRTTVTQEETYKDWLLRKLGLPRLEVPSAPTRAESDPTPVTISDYLLYCFMSQRDVAEGVFGHTDTFKNIKRKYVFEILYGRYNVVMAELQEELREVDAKIRQIRAQKESFESVLGGTPWENRAELLSQRDAIMHGLREVEASSTELASLARIAVPASAQMSARLRELDAQIAEHESQHENQVRSIHRLEELVDQLHAQIAKLTRSIVADELLAEIDFVLCPRCGSDLDSHRAEEGLCPLCLQQPQYSPGRDALIEEQDRLDAQVRETVDLVQAHRIAVDNHDARIVELRHKRSDLGAELDYASASFVSDSAQTMKQAAAHRAELAERVKRLDDYLLLYDRLDDLGLTIGELERRSVQLRAQIDAESDKEGHFAERIGRLEANLRTCLETIGLPDFVDPATARIDRDSYLPVINDRSFSQLSSPGLKLLVNVAHAVAHHQTALDLDLKLPGFLVVDGLGSYLGHEGFDRDRLLAAYGLLKDFAESNRGRVQVIVADNDHISGYESYECLTLTPTDRLVPQDGLPSVYPDDE
jgi:hypothetical protein